MILSDVPLEDRGDETDEAVAEAAAEPPPESPPEGHGTLIMGSVPTLPQQEAPSPPPETSATGPAPGSLIGSVDRPPSTPPTAADSGEGRGTQVMGSVPGVPRAPTPQRKKAPTPPKGPDLSGRSAYTRVIMGGKDEGLAKPSTPSAAASPASTPSRPASPAPSKGSVPTWLIAVAAAVAVAVVVFMILALGG
jgi:hypothetical protein